MSSWVDKFLKSLRQPVDEKENSEFKPTLLRFKIDLRHILTFIEGLGKYVYGNDFKKSNGYRFEMIPKPKLGLHLQNVFFFSLVTYKRYPLRILGSLKNSHHHQQQIYLVLVSRLVCLFVCLLGGQKKKEKT